MTAPQTPAVPMWGGGPGDPVAQGPHAIAFHGSSFCVSEPEGDVVPGRPQGYFRHDTRLLSRWELLIDGRRPEPLTRFSPTPAEIRFVQRMPPRLGGSDTALLVERRRRVGSRLIDEVRLRNLSAESVSVAVTLRVDGDFADVFAVKEGRVPASRRTVSVRPTGSLVIRGELPEQGVKVSMSGASYGPDGLRADVALDAFGSTVLIAEARPTSPAGTGVRRLGAARTLAERRRSTLSSIDPEVGYVIDRSLVDIDSLRITDPDNKACVAVAAGAPWFMALFGRDSLITAYMTLPLQRDLAVGTLPHARRQARARRSTRSARSSPAGSCTRPGSRATPDSPSAAASVYYGSIDATPLFVVLLGELWRWGEPLSEIQRPGRGRATARWSGSRTYGDPDGDGFVEYERSSERGLANQGWKDSWNGVTFADGTLAEPPIALCEVQGYVYAALRGRADMARAARRRQARPAPGRPGEPAARRASTTQFWLPDRGYYAMALDGSKRPVDSLTSNMGHCSGPASCPRSRRAAVADLLLSDECSAGGASAPWRRRWARTTRSATTTAPSGRTTTPSSRTAWRSTGCAMRPALSPRRCWTWRALRWAAAGAVRRLLP